MGSAAAAAGAGTTSAAAAAGAGTTSAAAAGAGTTSAAAAAKCDGFLSASVCVKTCPEGYTCDGTAKVTKKKVACPADVAKTEKCVACPDGHTCANGVATIEGSKVAATTGAPAAKLSNSNTLSVALPLCLTALMIMFK